jgi:hypothetical protein
MNRRNFLTSTTLAALATSPLARLIPGAPEWKFGEQLRDVNLKVMFEALK